MELSRGSPKGFKTLELKLKELSGLYGQVGWFENSKYSPSGIPVAGVMAIQELGHGPIPPRPFFRPTATDKKQEWSGVAAAGAKQVLNGALNGEQAMEQLTVKAENDVKDTILNITEPKLSPITIELRAMKKRDPNLHITGATVGIAAAKVNKPGYQTPSVSVKPLIDSGKAIATLTHKVSKI